MKPRNASVAVIGAGDFIGSAIAQRFAAEGYVVFAGRRTADKLATLKDKIEAAGGRCVARGLDARVEEDITAFIEEADSAAPLEVCVFNPGANVNYPILETTERVSARYLGAGLLRRLPHGARGGAAHAAAGIGLDLLHRRHGLDAWRRRLRAVRGRQVRLPGRSRSPAAREARPQGIHVAHLIIDSGVDTDFVRDRIRARGGEAAVENLRPDQLMNPASIGEAYWQLHNQHRDAWTHELDLRPYGEKW